MTTAYGTDIPTDGGDNDTWGLENNALWTAAPTYTERLQGLLVISNPTDSQAEYLTYHARFPFTVKRVAYQCLPASGGGSATLAFKIDGSNIGGLSSVSATDSKSTSDATSANTVSAGSYVTVTPTSIAAATDRIVIAIWGDRTGAGTSV